jgi:hypothetical protein
MSSVGDAVEFNLTLNSRGQPQAVRAGASCARRAGRLVSHRAAADAPAFFRSPGHPTHPHPPTHTHTHTHTSLCLKCTSGPQLRVVRLNERGERQPLAGQDFPAW